MAEAWIGLGSNLGDRREHLRAALRELSLLGTIKRGSSLYETEPVGFAEQGPFLNGVLCLETPLPPRELMRAMLRIEAGRGRVREQRNGPRTLDLDLLFYGDSVLDETGLALPHPRLHERRFVLQPLCEIAPGLRHPLLGRTVRELLQAVQDPGGVNEFEPYPGWAS